MKHWKIDLQFISFFLVGFLISCASGPKHYVTNEQLRYRISSYCIDKGYEGLKNSEPFHKTYTECMSRFMYSEDESWVREDWRSK